MVLHHSFMENPTSPAIPEALAASLDAADTPSNDNSFGEILSEFEQTSPRPNEINEALEGTVVSISPESVFVDIGRKVDGVVPVEKFRDAAGALTVQVGDKLRVSITGRDEEGSLHAFHHQSGAAQGLERAGTSVRREARDRRRGHRVGEGRPARGCRLAGVLARFAQRRPRIRRNWKSWWARRSSAGSSSWIPRAKTWWSIAAWFWKRKKRGRASRNSAS